MPVKIQDKIPLCLLSSVILTCFMAQIFGALKNLDYSFKQIGSIFIELLKMLVVPLALVAITNAIIKLGSAKLRHLSFRFIFLTVGMSLLGFFLGYILMNFWDIPVMPTADATVKPAQAPTILEFIRNCIPVNPFMSLAKGNMLQVITMTFCIGLAVLNLRFETQKTVVCALDLCQSILIKIANGIIYFAPIGVFCLLYPVMAKNLGNMTIAFAQMICMLIVGSLIYMAVVSIPLLFASGLEKPIQFFKIIILEDLIGAIAGGASNYMAPRIKKLKETTNLQTEIIDFFIPITSVLTRMGSTICVGIYTVFAASIFGISLSTEQIFLAAFLTVIALMCAPGIIGGTLMDCAIVWAAVGIPIEAIAVIAGIDYVMDMLRTVLNIQGGEIITACMNQISIKKGEESQS